MLNEQIKCILQSNDTMSVKTDKLAALGLTPLDIRLIYAANNVNQNQNRPIRTSSVITFGVEIECKADVEKFKTNCTEKNLPIVDKRNYAYRDYHVDNENCFKIVKDGSVNGCVDNGQYLEGIECVSQVMKSTDFKYLKNVCYALQDAKGKTNSECGLHVHLGLQGLNNNQKFKLIKNILINYYKMQGLINASMPEHRRNNYYSKNISDYQFEKIKNASTLSELKNAFYDRYYVINLQSIERHNTIEFRQHNGTIFYNVIEKWVKFLIKLFTYSKEKIIENQINNWFDIDFLTENEKMYFQQRVEKFN